MGIIIPEICFFCFMFRLGIAKRLGTRGKHRENKPEYGMSKYERKMLI